MYGKRDVVLIIVAALTILLTVGCANEGPENQYAPSDPGTSVEFDLTSRDFKVGVAPLPRSFPDASQEDWQEMYKLLPEVAEIVNGQDADWRALLEHGLGSSLVSLAGNAQEDRGLTAVFGLNYYDARQLHQEGTLNIDWSSEEDRAAYRDLALDICTNYDAKYLALGLENNFHFRYRPQDYDLWVRAYRETYDAVKEACPDTKVFVTFQYEMTRGLGTEYWGERDPEWEILMQFGNRLDLVAFTTYPEFEFDAVDEIPADYYAEIAEHTDKPIAFTEIGWQNGEGEFISRFVDLTEDLDKEFVLWTFMHDTKLAENNPLPEVGLREHDGTPKEAWYAWKALKEVPYRGE
jgi:hypothetical protein